MDAGELGRLKLRSRRGMKELDVLLERYVERRLGAADVAEREDYAALLETQDPELAAYLLHGAQPDAPAHARAVRRILDAAQPSRR